MTKNELSADDLTNLLEVLNILNKITEVNGVNLCAFGRISISMHREDTILVLGSTDGKYYIDVSGQ